MERVTSLIQHMLAPDTSELDVKYIALTCSLDANMLTMKKGFGVRWCAACSLLLFLKRGHLLLTKF